MSENNNAKYISVSEIEKIVAGKKISYEAAANERSETPSTWYVDKRDPAETRIITFKQDYDVVSETKTIGGPYQLKLHLNQKTLKHKITLILGHDLVHEIPDDLWQQAFKKLTIE